MDAGVVKANYKAIVSNLRTSNFKHGIKTKALAADATGIGPIEWIGVPFGVKSAPSNMCARSVFGHFGGTRTRY